MSLFSEHLEKVATVLTTYQALIDSHLVDFITENLWDQCLPKSLRNELETLSSNSIINAHFYGQESATPELYKFCKLINALSLDKCNLVYDLIDIPDLFLEWGIDVKNLESKIHNSRLDFMNEKKSYEVEIVARITSSLAKIHSSAVIDAGAGKGYLSQHISEKYKIPVLAIDSSDIAHRGAIRRQNILRKKPNQSSHLVHHLAQRIDECTEFAELAEKYFPTWSLSENLTLTGLHTCGSLGHSVIKAFLKTDCIKSLCLVTCCYHLAETSLSGKLNISKNAKMLAQQSVQRSCQNEYSLSPTLHYRAVFQVLLHSLGMQDVKVGRGAPVDNFVTYAKWALNKIGLDPTQIPPDNVIEELYCSHESFKAKMELFQTLRIRLGSVVESAILLDRIIYLEESKVCSNFALVRLFDPLISPRCYGIIAIK